MVFTLNTKYFILLSSCLHDFWDEGGYNSYLCFFIGLFAPHTSVKIFFFDFLWLKMRCLGVCILASILLTILWDFWIYGLFCYINLYKFLANIVSHAPSIAFSLFLLVFPLYIWYVFCSYPTVLGYSVPFSSVFVFNSFKSFYRFIL